MTQSKSNPLDPSEIRSRLKDLPKWKINTQGEITRIFEFKDFPHALLFVNTVGHLAERMDHHPDIDIRWNKVTLSLITHSAKGLTQLDFSLAQEVDGVVT